MEEVKLKHPSICYDCEFARKMGSDENELDGYVGCVAKFDQFPMGNPSIEDIAYIAKAETIGTAWIRHKVRPFAKMENTLSYGIMTNGQIITRQVESCKEFKQLNDN